MAEGEEVWGRHDAERDGIEIEREPSPQNEDLLDYAAVADPSAGRVRPGPAARCDAGPERRLRHFPLLSNGKRQMEEPLEIAFHNLEPSDALETEIRERFAKLEKLYDRMTGCRISVEALHKQHRTGNIFEVHIDMLVPGGELVVSKQPQKAKQRFANPDVYVSVREAFKAAERQLIDYKRQLCGRREAAPAPVPGSSGGDASRGGLWLSADGRGLSPLLQP